MQKYKLVNKLSSGAFGTVYNAEVLEGPLQGQEVAIKQIYLSDLVKRELQILTELKPHPNIISCYEVVEQNKFERAIVMQRGTYDLDQFIESLEYPINEEIVKTVAKGLLSGLQQLHKQGFIHRDLKPSNIVVKKCLKTVAICDFGSAVKCTTGQQYVIQGFTRWYKPPEMLFGSRTYKYEVDLWSLGCILFQLATGEQLFPGKSELQQIALISNFIGDPSAKNWPSVVNFHDYGKINFMQKTPKSNEQISKQYGLSLRLVNFLMRMIKYQGRATVQELLSDQFLKLEGNQQIQLKLGIFGTQKIEPKIVR